METLHLHAPPPPCNPTKASFLEILLIQGGSRTGRDGVPDPRGCCDMTNKLQADNVSKTYWSLLCCLGLPSVPPQRQRWENAAGAVAAGGGPPVPGRLCKLSRPSVRLLNERNGLFPPPSHGGPGVLALHKAGDPRVHHRVSLLALASLLPPCWDTGGPEGRANGDTKLTEGPSQSTRTP